MVSHMSSRLLGGCGLMEVTYMSYYYYYRDPGPTFPLGLLSMTPVADRGLAGA